MDRLITLVVAFFWLSAAQASWKEQVMWDWILNTANPQIQQLEADNVALQAQVDALEADGGADPLESAVAQVRTALDLLPVFQEAVARSFRETGEAPATRVAAGLTSAATDTQTNFIVAVDVNDGVIIITFGNDADPLISGLELPFTPYESVDLTITWRCGADPEPLGTSLLGASGGGVTATYVAPTIPPSTYPDPCILTSQPGSSDDLIRAQVLEGIALATPAQAAVAEYFSSTGEPPATRAIAGMTAVATDTVGNYVESVQVTNGTVTITYGNQVNPLIALQTLTLTPYESLDLSVVWRCGLANEPAGTWLMGTSGTGAMAAYAAPTLMPWYLPHYCRP